MANMLLSYESITSFQYLYKKKCGVSLKYEEAEVKASEELRRFSLIYQAIPGKEIDDFRKFGGLVAKIT